MIETAHTFHIPVMGTAFTIDSPVKVARYGIASVISCVDDTLIEKMRRFYCRETGEEYIPIKPGSPDVRAHRITAYLNLVDRLVKEQFERLKSSAFDIGTEITKYFELLPDESTLKQMYRAMLAVIDPVERAKAQDELRGRIRPGAIDINIMTKLDRTNYDEKGEALPVEYNDALAALRGYANSTLSSSVVFSAGFNGRLYSYVDGFKDFHADESGFIKKKIIIKVNDYRSAYTQGKFFAKKGLWVSEYRLESGLNCGGHAFGQGGHLMGPSLEEFKNKRDELISSLFEIYNKALSQKKRPTFKEPHRVKITAQGGIGTAGEHQFLLSYYQLDGTGWGTPFLLVPEATITDSSTLEKLRKATEEDLLLSDVSPLGIPFNNLRNSASEEAKAERIRSGKSGSPCSKGHLVSNTEFSERPICTASYHYQKKKIEEIQAQHLDPEAYEEAYQRVVVKACLCNDLGGTAMISHNLHDPGDLPSPPAICPGPNLAYFSRISSLQEMIDHIYGRANLLNALPRPSMFVKELDMYIDYLEDEVKKSLKSMSEQRLKYLNEYKTNLLEGVSYYKGLVQQMSHETQEYRERMRQDLNKRFNAINDLIGRYRDVFFGREQLAANCSN